MLKILDEAREKENLQYSDLRVILGGTTRQNIWRLFVGENKMSIATLLTVCDKLNVRLADVHAQAKAEWLKDMKRKAAKKEEE